MQKKNGADSVLLNIQVHVRRMTRLLHTEERTTLPCKRDCPTSDGVSCLHGLFAAVKTGAPESWPSLVYTGCLLL